MSLSDFYVLIFALCKIFGGSTTSGIRSVKRNASVGGVIDSKHLTGFGVDIVLDDPKSAPAFKAAVRAVGLAWLDEGDHFHVQTRIDLGLTPMAI